MIGGERVSGPTRIGLSESRASAASLLKKHEETLMSVH